MVPSIKWCRWPPYTYFCAHLSLCVYRTCRTAASRHYGRAFLCVGLVATLYHGSSGACRRVARKLDYWTIAYSSNCLRGVMMGPAQLQARAGACHRALNLVALLGTPFKPSLVSTANLLLVEVRGAAYPIPTLIPTLMLPHDSMRRNSFFCVFRLLFECI